jgi:flagellar hook-associated protein 2
MPGLQLTGLASGLDWRSLVDKLIATERVPQDRLRAQKVVTQQKTNVLDALKTSLTALQTSIQSLSGGSGDVFAARTAKLADTASGWTASAGAATEIGSYVVDVTQLATKTQRAGGLDIGNALSATSDVSALTIATLPIGSTISAGEFTVNGARVSVAATDSLQDVLDRISTSTGGFVTASYDPSVDKIRLTGGGEVVLGSANDTSNFLMAMGLTNNGTTEVLSPKALGVVSVSKAIADANLRTAVTAVDGGGNGSFSINGVSIAYNVNTDTVSTVMARINASGAGVTASYDRLTDRFTLNNKTTGDTGMAVSEAAGGLLDALGLGGAATLNRGKNAQFSVDGGPTLTSLSNTLDGETHGITGLSVTANSEGTQTINVAGDTAALKSKIEDFISKFNSVQTIIDQQTKITPGSDGKVTAAIFASNHEISDIGSSLRSKVFETVPGLSGTIQRLENLGIDFSGTKNELVIKDATKLDAALTGNAEQVRELFSNTTNGLAARLNSFLSIVTGSTGTLATQTSSLSSQGKSLDAQIAAMERHIVQQQRLLEQSFIRMESAQAQIQNQLASLTNAFGGSSSSGQ